MTTSAGGPQQHPGHVQAGGASSRGSGGDSMLEMNASSSSSAAGSGAAGGGPSASRAGPALGFITPETVVNPTVVMDCTCCFSPDAGEGWYRGRAGTSAYWCPAMLQRDARGERLPYGCDSDWWSYGCLVYCLMTGRSPFASGLGSQYDNALTLEARLSWPRGIFSREAKDFISRLLHPDPAQRLGAGPHGWQEVMSHPWFAKLDWGLLEAKVIPAPVVPHYRMATDLLVPPEKVAGQYQHTQAREAAAAEAAAITAAAALELTAEDEAIFRAVTYTAPDMLLRAVIKAPIPLEAPAGPYSDAVSADSGAGPLPVHPRSAGSADSRSTGAGATPTPPGASPPSAVTGSGGGAYGGPLRGGQLAAAVATFPAPSGSAPVGGLSLPQLLPRQGAYGDNVLPLPGPGMSAPMATEDAPGHAAQSGRPGTPGRLNLAPSAAGVGSGMGALPPPSSSRRHMAASAPGLALSTTRDEAGAGAGDGAGGYRLLVPSLPGAPASASTSPEPRRSGISPLAEKLQAAQLRSAAPEAHGAGLPALPAGGGTLFTFASRPAPSARPAFS
jgi:hypothetical protein